MDKYDEAIEHLTENPCEIMDFWEQPAPDTYGCLFQFCGDALHLEHCGCPVMIRAGISIAATPALTAQIGADERIPKSPRAITAEHLQAFAEWQRKIDAMGVR